MLQTIKDAADVYMNMSVKKKYVSGYESSINDPYLLNQVKRIHICLNPRHKGAHLMFFTYIVTSIK